MVRKNFPERKQLRREEAEERAAEREKRSPQQQLERLDKILGVGVGATKERERLKKLINSKKEKEGVEA